MQNKTKIALSDVHLLEQAIAEFSSQGRVGSVKCDVCNGLIEITELGDAALTVKCECGKFDDTLRGL